MSTILNQSGRGIERSERIKAAMVGVHKLSKEYGFRKLY